MQKLITVLFFTMLLVLGTSSYATASATYSVDMNGYSGSFTTVYISGTFNGWSDFANPLSDEDGDGIWSTFVDIPVGGDYKFQVDGWADQENFTDGDPCTQTFEGGFINRIYSGGEEVCFTWASCSACGEASVGGNTGGGNTGGGSEEAMNSIFSVDMTAYSGSFSTVFISGTFNGWCGGCNPLSDEDGDGIWSGPAEIPAGSDYKFQVDEWADQEEFTDGDPCTQTFDGQFVNRIHDGASEVCFTWASCSACSTTPTTPTTPEPEPTDITFSVDMNAYSGSFSTVFISGTFNSWCGGCNPLSDEDGDGIWSGTASIPVGSDYKFQVDEFADQEMFTDGDPCTQTFGESGEFVNRIYDGAAEVCFTWATCSTCSDGSGTVPSASFSVDMNNYSEAFSTVFISGTFNAWCGGCNPLSDEDGDGIWSGTASIPVGSDYKFQVDEFAAQEEFTDGDPCTQTFGENGEFINRIYDGAAEVCFTWASCSACGEGSTNENPTNENEGENGGSTMTSTIFADYPWLGGIVDANNCDGTTIQVYRSTGFVYLYVQTASSSILYNANGTVWCTTLPNFNCLDFYTIDEEIENFTCGGNNGDDSTGSSEGTDGGDSTDGSEGTDDGDSTDGSEGTDDGDSTDGSEGTDSGNSGDNGGSDMASTIFADYPWLGGIVDPNNCDGTTIQVYRSTGFVYLYVQTASSSILYNANGNVWCTTLPNFNCLDFYTVDEEIENFTCGGGQISEDEEITPAFKASINQDNTNALATEFSVYPNPSNGLFFVELATSSDIDRSLTILNVQGQIVQQQFLAATTAEQKITFNLTNQAAGMYFIRVSSKEGNSVKRLVVK